MTLYFKLMYRKVAFGHKKVVTVSKFSKDRISKILKKILMRLQLFMMVYRIALRTFTMIKNKT